MSSLMIEIICACKNVIVNIPLLQEELKICCVLLLINKLVKFIFP